MPGAPADQMSRRRRFARIAIALLSLLILQIPLCNYLGYEYATAVAMVLPWIAGPLTLAALRRGRRRPSYLSAVGEHLREGSILALIPLLIGAANIVMVRNCSLGEGILFFLLIPFVTAVFSIALALLCGTMFRRPALWYAVIVLSIFSYGLYLGYFTPQISSYNLVYGFFPGFSYDEILTITPTLVLFRGVTLVVALFLLTLAEFFWLARWTNSAPGRIRLAAIRSWRGFPFLLSLFLALLLVWAVRDRLGFETSDRFLNDRLNNILHTPHFLIHTVPGNFTDEELVRIGNEHEFRYSQVVRTLRTQDERPIVSYIYPDEETQERMIGTRQTNISKPWRREIHTSRASWETTLRHELVHAMAGEFGLPVIHAHYNIGLVEGLAMAVDGDFGNRTLDEYSAAVLQFGLVRDPERLVAPVGFALQSSGLSYVLMGSFCRYLIDRHGIVNFKALYGGRSPEQVYGRGYGALIAEWEGYLDEIHIPAWWEPHVRFYFDRPSIFARVCARRIAALNEEGYRKLDRGEILGAENVFRRSFRLSRNSGAYAGLLRSAYAAGEYDSLLELFARQDSSLRASTQSLELYRGDALWSTGHTDSAASVYGHLRGLDLSDRLNEAVVVRLALLRSPALAAALKPVVVTALSDSLRGIRLDSLAAFGSDPLLHFLQGRSLLRRQRYAEALRVSTLAADSLGDPELRAGARLSAGEAAFFLRRYQEARRWFWLSLNDRPGAVARQRIDDWLDRCVWYERSADNALHRRAD